MAGREVLRELVTVLGYQVDDKGLLRAKRGISSFQSFAVKAFTAIGAFRLGAGAYKFAAEMDTARASLEVLVGSGQKTGEMLQQLRQYSEQLRPSWAQFSDAAKQLLVYGVEADKVVKVTRELTDVSGGSIDRFNRLAYAIGQIKSAGYLKGTELRQLTEAGFDPLAVISERTGTSRPDLMKLMEKRAISVQAVYKALEVVSSKGGRFYGLAEKQAKTLSGSFDVLRNNLQNTAYDFIQYLSPAIIRVNRDLTEFIQKQVKPWIDANKTAIRDFVNRGMYILRDAFLGVKDAFVAFWPLLKLVLTNLPVLLKMFLLIKATQFGLFLVSIAQALRKKAIWLGIIIPLLETLYLAFLYIKEGNFAVIFTNIASSMGTLFASMTGWLVILSSMAGWLTLIYVSLSSIYNMWKMWQQWNNQKEYTLALGEQASNLEKIAELEKRRANLAKTVVGSPLYYAHQKELEQINKEKSALEMRNMDVAETIKRYKSLEGIPEGSVAGLKQLATGMTKDIMSGIGNSGIVGAGKATGKAISGVWGATDAFNFSNTKMNPADSALFRQVDSLATLNVNVDTTKIPTTDPKAFGIGVGESIGPEIQKYMRKMVFPQLVGSVP